MKRDVLKTGFCFVIETLLHDSKQYFRDGKNFLSLKFHFEFNRFLNSYSMFTAYHVYAMSISLVIISLLAMIVQSNAVAYDMNSQSSKDLTSNDSVNDLAFDSASENPHVVASENHESLLNTNDRVGNICMDTLLDDNLEQRDLQHQEFVKRQSCQSIFDRPRNRPTTQKSRAIRPEDDDRTKADDPCEGLEHKLQLTCGGVFIPCDLFYLALTSQLGPLVNGLVILNCVYGKSRF